MKTMSHEEARSLGKLIHGAIDALEAFKRTGQRVGFVATQDQIEAHEKEFDSYIKIQLPE